MINLQILFIFHIQLTNSGSTSILKKLFLVSFFLFPILSWGQKLLNQPDIYFEHLYLPGALHFNPINDIAQDSSSLLWFASDNGIYRYDGYSIINSNDHKEFNSVKERPIWSILSGPNNIIYASLKDNRGLFKVKNDFSDLEYFKEELLDYNLHELFFFQNKLAFLSKGKGLFFFDEVNKKVVPFRENNEPVFSVTTSEGKLYAGAYKKLIIYSDTVNYEEIEIPQLENFINSIFTSGNTLFISTEKNVYEYDLQNKKVVKTFFTDELKDDQINAVHKDNNGNLWVLTQWNGIYIFKPEGSVTKIEKHHYQKGSISNNKTNTIYQCHNNIIWIGTGGGINKYDQHKRYFSLLTHIPSNPTTISTDLIRSVYETKNEEVLIGTDDGVLNILDSARKKISRIRLKLPGVSSKIVPFNFLEDPFHSNVIYTGTNEGLIQFDTKAKTCTKVNSPVVKGDRRVRQILLYKKDKLLCLSRGHVWVSDLKTKNFKFLGPHKKDHLKILNDNARTLFLDDEDNLFIGGVGEVAYYHPESEEFHSRRIADITEEGDTVNHMILDIQRYDDKLYIGTFQGGLYVLDIKDKKLQGNLKHFSKAHGLPDNTTYSALRDNKGFIWISTNNGISRFNPENETFYNFDRDNGLQGEEFNRLAFTQTKRGEFIFGGIEGLNIFFPDNIFPSDKYETKPILLNVDIINQFDENGTLKNPSFSLMNAEVVKLNYDQNYLNFKFSSSNFSQPDKNKFYYKLENYDKEWIYSTKPSATYTGLKPGQYVFHLKSISPDGSISSEKASIPIQVTTRWWKTWWAGLLFGSVLLGLVSYSFRQRFKKNQAIKVFLEKEIERRTKELKESKEELARLNKKKDFIFSILSHDLRSPLTTLKGFLGILVDHFDTLDEKDIKIHAVNIKNSVAKSLDLLDNTLFWSLSQMGDISFTPSKVDMGSLFEKLIGLYDLTAQKKKIKIKTEIEPGLSIYADENMTYITLRNLVSNALKFTPQGKCIYLRAYEKDAQVIIEVADEGKGIRPEDLSKLFDQNQNFMQKGTSNEKGTGLGLILCKKFTDMNNGSITVESTENFGSKFTLKLPLFKQKTITS